MRHGEVDNPDGVLYGRLRGYPLTELGYQMAEAGANYLAEQDADLARVVASPLLRAQQTAQPAARIFGVPVECDTRLIESGNVFEGQVIRKSPTTLLAPSRLKHYWNPLRPSWGEPYTHQARRMAAAVSAALNAAPGRQSLLVSHQLPIWMLRSFAEGLPLPHDPRKRECALGSITSFYFSGHTLTGIDYVVPAADLMPMASDVTPGQSAAAINRG